MTSARDSPRVLRLARPTVTGLVARLDPGLRNMREATVVMAATLASFGTALAIEHAANLSANIVILAVALSLSLGRTGKRAGHQTLRGRAQAVIVLPIVAICANEIGTQLFKQQNLGDALFVIAVSATIWVRRFGPGARRVATIATLPLIAILIVPAPVIAANGSADASRWWSALVALVAFGWVTTTRWAAERSGFLAPTAELPAAPPLAAPTPAPGRRLLSSTKMALQMAVSLGAAFTLGRLLFGTHWTWVVLTAFIVCSGNRGRGDVVHKAAMRLAGAAAGTIAATALSGAFAVANSWSIVVIFLVLSVALWLRPVNYAYWAGGMTAALALLYGYYGESSDGILATRLEAILVGAAVAVAVSWVLLPVRTTDVLRRDIAVALAALDRYLASLHEDLASAVELQDRFRQAVETLAKAGPMLRAIPGRFRSDFDRLPALNALEECAAELPSVTDALTARGTGEHWREHLNAVRASVGALRRDNAKRLPTNSEAWGRLAACIRELPRALDP